ncbi:MAG: hypothetical protein HY719_09865 [Planctomycetes bacterium]|nr:hypothetical protein [Planctomycetota bacterium]
MRSTSNFPAGFFLLLLVALLASHLDSVAPTTRMASSGHLGPALFPTICVVALGALSFVLFVSGALALFWPGAPAPAQDGPAGLSSPLTAGGDAPGPATVALRRPVFPMLRLVIPETVTDDLHLRVGRRGALLTGVFSLIAGAALLVSRNFMLAALVASALMGLALLAAERLAGERGVGLRAFVYLVFVAYAFFLSRVGFLLSTAAAAATLVFVLLRGPVARSLLVSLLFGAAVAVGVFLVFNTVLEVAFPQAVIGFDADAWFNGWRRHLLRQLAG